MRSHFKKLFWLMAICILHRRHTDWCRHVSYAHSTQRTSSKHFWFWLFPNESIYVYLARRPFGAVPLHLYSNIIIECDLCVWALTTSRWSGVIALLERKRRQVDVLFIYSSGSLCPYGWLVMGVWFVLMSTSDINISLNRHNQLWKAIEIIDSSFSSIGWHKVHDACQAESPL